jgi:hypothetical protein
MQPETFAPSVAQPLSDLDVQYLRRCQLRELKKRPGWKQASPRARHVLARMVDLARTHSGEVFKSERKLAALIPPAPKTDGRGRPNRSGHISREVLRAAQSELRGLGLLSRWKTNGRVYDGLPRRGIYAYRFCRTAWARAWATLKYARRRYFRPSKSRGYSLRDRGGRTRLPLLTIDDFRARLKRARRSPNGWEACCPAHHDRTPSLSVAQGDRGIVFRCHSGCAPDDVLAAIGVEWSQLFTDEAETLRAEYDRLVRDWIQTPTYWRAHADWLKSLAVAT